MNNKKRLIIGVSGATGAIYGVRMLEILAKMDEIETHLVLEQSRQDDHPSGDAVLG